MVFNIKRSLILEPYRMELIGYTNFFRLTGDFFHLFAIIILLVKIIKTRSCAGISGKSQILYAIVFVTRYLDLFRIFISLYNVVLKVTFIILSVTTVLLVFIPFRKTYDRKNDSFPIAFLLIPAAVLAFYINHDFTVEEVLWTFSIYLEAVAILPQLFMISQRGEFDSIVCHYLFALGSYRAFYLMSWILRYNLEYRYDLITIFSSIVQIILYWKFFYIYFTRVLRFRSDSAAKNKECNLDRLREVVHQEFCTLDGSKGKNKNQSEIGKTSCDKLDENRYSAIYCVDI